jgi:hypothetical protein
MRRGVFTRVTSGAVAAVAIALAGLVPAATTAAAAGQTISGVVTLPGGPEAAALDALTVTYAPEGSSSYKSVNVTDTGAFSITDLAPGKYHVCAYTSAYFDDAGGLGNPRNVLNACFNTANYFGTRGTLDVSTSSLTGLTLALPWGRTISGAVTLAAGADPEWMRGVRVSAFRPVTGGFIGAHGTLDPDTGRYTVYGLYPGSYPVVFAVDDYVDPATGATVAPGLAGTNHPSEVDVSVGDVSGIDATVATAPVTGRFTVVPQVGITGSPVVGSTLTAVSGAWSPTATSLTYQWFRGGTPIDGATARTYTVDVADLDQSIQLRVGATAPGVSSGGAFSSFVYVRSTFTTVGTPLITGSRAVGSTLTCSPGTWAPAPTVQGYQWIRGTRDILGAEQSTYTVRAADEGQQLRCRVWAGREVAPYQVRSVSAPVTVLRKFTAPGSVTIAGTRALGSTLTASVTGTTPAASTVAYQWYRNGAAIPGAVGASYVVVRDDGLATLGARATVRRSGFADATTALATVTVPGFFAATPAPQVDGDVRAGGTLTATVPAWTPVASFSYQWLRNGAAIPGATASSYTLTGQDERATVAVRVVGSRTSFVAQTVTSAGVVVPPSFAVAPIPTVAGSTAAGGTLTVSTGAWSPTPESFTYQWLRNGSAIAGADASTYVVAETDGGTAISVRVTAAAAGLVTTSVVSEPVAVPLWEFTTTPTPTISGTAREGRTLTAWRGSWAPAPSSVTYRWSRNGVAISGATASTYVLTAADQGQKITVTVTAKRAGYRTVAVTSAPTTVLREFAAAPAPTITGTAKAGSTLTAWRGTWTPSPTTTTFRWYRNGVAISGATAKTYTLRSADRGSRITVKVTGARSGYATLTRTSAGVTVAS